MQKEKLKDLENSVFNLPVCFVHFKISFVFHVLLIDSSSHLRVFRCEQIIKKNVSSWYFYSSKGRHNSLVAWPLVSECQTSPGSFFKVISTSFSAYMLVLSSFSNN